MSTTSTTQYRDASSLNARIQIYRYSTAAQSWPEWLFEQLDLPESCRILELGCGTGGLWKTNASRVPKGWEIALSDASPGMLEEAMRTLDGVDHAFSYEVIDAQAIPFDDASFDAVIANHMLYHVPDRFKALSEIRCVLRPGGRFRASTNGRSHTCELAELLTRFDVPFAEENRAVVAAFGLENGCEQLEPWFENVGMRVREDCLAVPDADAIVRYALSLDSAKSVLVGERLDAFASAVQRQIAECGPMRITLQAGVFLCQ